MPAAGHLLLPHRAGVSEVPGGEESQQTYLVPITHCPGAFKCIVSALHILTKVSHVTCDHPDGCNSGPAKLIGTDIH